MSGTQTSNERVTLIPVGGMGRLASRKQTSQGQEHLERDIRLEERSRESARILHELHDTLFQGFLAASMLVHQAAEQTPGDSPSKPLLSRALRLVRRAIDEGRAALQGLHTAVPLPASLEEAFSDLLNELTPERGGQLRIFIQGKPQVLKPAIREQLFLIGREAVVNALRHSHATNIQVEVQHLRRLLRLLVRDNGCGIHPDAVQKARESHWGLRGMHDRAEKIGAQFGIWSRPGAGTEVRVAYEFASKDEVDLSAAKAKGRRSDDAARESTAANR
jgi:signal transduction histidine kinase